MKHTFKSVQCGIQCSIFYYVCLGQTLAGQNALTKSCVFIE